MNIELTTGKKFDEDRKEIAILPTGSIERHGDFLPLGTDTLVPYKIAMDINERFPIDVYPPIFYGISLYLTFAKGTVSVNEEIYKKYVENVIEEIFRQGYKAVIILNGHGGNTIILRQICQNIVLKSDRNIHCIVIDWWRDLAQDTRKKLFEKPGHAGEDETSIMLYLYHEYVDKGYLDKVNIEYPERISSKHYFKKLYDVLYPHAYTGDPSKANIEKGKIWYDAILKELSYLIERLIKMM